MKSVLRIFSTAVICLALILSLTACGDSLRGTWVSSMSNRATSISFRSSGAVELNQGSFTLEGTYSVSGDVITLNLADEHDEMYQITMKYKLDGKKLYLVNENGKTEIFVK